MSDQTPPSDDHSPRSPLRPQRPAEFELPPAEANANAHSPTEPSVPQLDKRYASEPESPSEKLAALREKIKAVVDEFNNRQISRAQFNAIYAHYNEQRVIVEQIIAKNPKNDGWKQASRSGKTSFLRNHFEARPLNYVVYLHRQRQPLMGAGTRPDMNRIASMLYKLWGMKEARVGVVCVRLDNNPQWLAMAVGYRGVTFVTYHLEPSGSQLKHVYELHKDFERANQIMLVRGNVDKSRMVFPQRSLIENKH